MSLTLMRRSAFILALLVGLRAHGADPVTLDSLIADSVARAYSLRQQKLRLDKTSNSRISAWTNLLPTVSASAGKSWNRTGSLEDDGSITTTRSRSASLAVSADWTLWNNYANIRDLKLASLDMESQEVQSDLQIQSHVIEVLDQYYGLQNLYISRAALAETLKNARAFAEEAAELVRLGGKTKLDMMDTEIQVRNFENEARELENTIAAAERALGVLLNAPDRVKLDPVDVVTARPYLMKRFESALPAIRKLSRDQVASVSPELRLSVLDVERSSQSLSQTRLGYFPVTSFRVSQEYDLAGFVTEDASANQRRMVPSLSAQFQVSWTVWDWLATHRNIVNTSKDLENSQIDLSKRSRQVANDFETQLEQYDILLKSIENAKLVVAQAEKQVEYTLAMYQLGRITLLQAQTASERLITARNSLASRLRQQYVAAARLMLQAGFNLLPDGVESPLLRTERPAIPSSSSL